MSLTPADYIDRLLDPVAKCLTPDVAERILDVELDPTVRNRLDELAAKAAAGTLTDDERGEYDGAVNLIDFIGMLQTKAGKLLE